MAACLPVLAGEEADAHKVRNAPKVRLLRAEAGPEDVLLRRLAVEVRDPTGKKPVSGAKVTARALHKALGSGLRVDPVGLVPGQEPGTYEGEIRFPQAGRWELIVEVVGRYFGDAHLDLDVSGGSLVSESGPPREKPELPFDLVTVRHLAMEWGHLAGFGLWLVATGVGLLDPARKRAFVIGGTWAALTIEGVTGLYKMEYSTPFAGRLRLFSRDPLPSVFFAEDYASTLVFKHALMVIAIGTSVILTVRAWRVAPTAQDRVWRDLLVVNLMLALAIAAAAAMLGFYHGIVVHFS